MVVGALGNGGAGCAGTQASLRRVISSAASTLGRMGGGTLPGLSLAMKAHAGYVTASALLRTFLGEQLGRRVQAGAIERGSG
jgi:hypothetical protein